MLPEDVQPEVHQLVVVGLVPGGAAELRDAAGLGKSDPDFGDQDAFHIKTYNIHGISPWCSRVGEPCFCLLSIAEFSVVVTFYFGGGVSHPETVPCRGGPMGRSPPRTQAFPTEGHTRARPCAPFPLSNAPPGTPFGGKGLAFFRILCYGFTGKGSQQNGSTGGRPHPPKGGGADADYITYRNLRDYDGCETRKPPPWPVTVS